MTKKHLLIPLLLGLGVSIALLCLLSRHQTLVTAAPSIGTRHVATTGIDTDNDCSNQGSPCRTIQHAVDVANAGDTIKVASGTYTDVHVRPRDDVTATGVVTQVAYIKKSVTIQGGYTTTNWLTPDPDAHPATLDAQGQGRVLYITGEITPAVEGLCITGGDATSQGGGPLPYDLDAGGGVYVVTAAATIRDNRILGNTASMGGGTIVLHGSAAIAGNAFFSNTAQYGGGLLLLVSNATVSGNSMYSNIAYSGGGVVLRDSGGELTGNSIFSNTAQYGGGVSLHESGATLSGNIIFANTAQHYGGGLDLYDSDDTLINNVVAENQTHGIGSGLYILASSPRLVHTTVAGNHGGDNSGIRVDGWESPYSTVALTNTVLVSHTVGISVSAGNTVTLESTLWGSGAWANDTDWGGAGTIVTGTNNVWGDPAFASDGYHLTARSAAIDQGVETEVQTDMDGDTRDAFPDLGADEFVHRVYLPLVTNDYPRTFKLGILGPFTGRSSGTGDVFKAAVEMAFDAIDWRIGTYNVEPVWIDSESNPSKAAQNYEAAILGDGVEAGLLNWHSSVAVSCMDVVADHQVPHFAGLGATEVVNETFNSDRQRYGYWTSKWWPRSGQLSVSYVQTLEHAISSGAWSPAAKSVVITGEDTDWGHSFGDAIRGHFQAAGWTVLGEAYFAYGQTDFSAAIAVLKTLEPAVVAGTTASSESMYALLNQADDADLESVIIADGLNWMWNWYEETGSSSDYVVDQDFSSWPTEEGKAFADELADKYGIWAGPSSAGLAYDAANFFISAAQATYEAKGELSSEALYEFAQEEIWTGQWTYTDGIMMEEYKYTAETIPDPVVGGGYYTFPIVQYFDGEGKIVFPPGWADQPFTPPGG